MATWKPNPNSTDDWQCDELVDDNDYVAARIETFDTRHYPMALNAATGNWERGGCYLDAVAAILWAERVAGIHPMKPTDERPPFYYTKKENG